jgi:hypothetical protein
MIINRPTTGEEEKEGQHSKTEEEKTRKTLNATQAIETRKRKRPLPLIFIYLYKLSNFFQFHSPFSFLSPSFVS